MSLFDIFKRVPSWTVEEVRAYVASHTADEYTLLDVRTKREYAAGHIKNALLIPVQRLAGALDSLDPKKQIIVYCAAGIRSRKATVILKRAGFPSVINMRGGYRVW